MPVRCTPRWCRPTCWRSPPPVVWSTDPVGGSTVGVGRKITVAVSATSANLGPGFDCLGLALDWREQVDLTVLPSGFEIQVSGEGADRIPRDESHLIIRSALVGLADLGVGVPGLGLAGHN